MERIWPQLIIKNIEESRKWWTNDQLLVISFLIRVFLVFYARIHDYFFDLNFTDIDYQVFSDGAFLISSGTSPFEQATYRYTPLIAWALLPNRYLADFGKILFSAVDVIVGWLQLHILNNEGANRINRRVVCLLWLFNPFNAIIATRGSSDSIISFLVLLTLYKMQNGKNQNYDVSALLHGAGATHLRIYPLIYLPSIFLHLSAYTWPWPGIRIFFSQALVQNNQGFRYILLSLSSFALLTGFFHLLYDDFLDRFLLYHLTRVDIRHNFSPYFLPLYLTMDRPELARLLGLVFFLPQLFCTIIFALRYSDDLPFCWFLTTFAFVLLNKVSTSQYFVWYLCFLPIVHQRIKMEWRQMLNLLFLWFFGQAQWLLPAYLLEFQGMNTFVWIWIASLLFLAINLFIMAKIIKAYSPEITRSGPKKEE